MSPGGALGISSSDDGSLNIWNTSDGVVRVNYVSNSSRGRFSMWSFRDTGHVILFKYLKKFSNCCQLCFSIF